MYSTYSLLCALRISARHSRRIGMVVSCGIEPAYSSFELQERSVPIPRAPSIHLFSWPGCQRRALLGGAKTGVQIPGESHGISTVTVCVAARVSPDLRPR